MRILLTNDDSHVSPLLAVALRALRKRGEVTVVVPAHEQSGTGKSVTIPRPLRLGSVEIAGQRCHTVDGTPADCTQVGHYHLVPGGVDLVVSGINMGRNCGVPFIVWSGTVGAALEANLAGVPAIALSQDLTQETWNHWTTYKDLPATLMERLVAQADTLVERVFDHLLGDPAHLREPVTWNVNLPGTPAPDVGLFDCAAGFARYGSCFRRTEDGFRFGLSHVDNEAHPAASATLLSQGHVALNRLDLRMLWRQEEAVRVG